MRSILLHYNMIFIGSVLYSERYIYIIRLLPVSGDFFCSTGLLLPLVVFQLHLTVLGYTEGAPSGSFSSTSGIFALCCSAIWWKLTCRKVRDDYSNNCHISRPYAFMDRKMSGLVSGAVLDISALCIFLGINIIISKWYTHMNYGTYFHLSL